MDISLAIKKGYFTALSPAIGIPVYDAFSVPNSAVYPYAIISEITARERIPNGCKIYDCVVTIDIVTGFSSPTGMNAAWILSEKITDIVNPYSNADLNLLAYGWEIGETRMLGSVPIQQRSENYWIYRNVLSFSHIVYPTVPNS